MKRNFERNIHIQNQIMGFCKKAGAAEINARIAFKDEHTTITVTSAIEALDEKTIAALRKQIGIPRQQEIEQNYWNLGLSGGLGDEMALVGMMVDASEVSYENRVLTITVQRRN